VKKTSLAKSALWVTLGTFISRFFALLSNLVLARLLSPEDFGVIGIAYVFWSFIVLFTQSSSGLFVLYKGIDDRRYLDTVNTISFLVGALFAASLTLVAPFIAIFFDEPSLIGILRIYAINLIVSSVFYVYEAIMLRQNQYRGVMVVNLVASIARLTTTVACALVGLKYWSFAFGDSAFWVVSLALVIWQSKHLLSFKIDRDVVAEVTRYCLGAVGTSLGFYANLNLDNFVVSKVLGKTSLGYYNLAYQLTMAITRVFNPVVSRLGTPTFAKLEDDEAQRQALIGVMTQIAFLITPVYALLLISLDQTLILFLFGAQWTSIVTIIPWLIVSAYCRAINIPMNAMLSAKGLTNINARVNLQIAPFAILGFYVGATQGGIVGVAIAVSLILGVLWVIYWWWTGCRILSWPIQEFALPFLLPLGLALLAILIALPLPIVAKQLAFLAVYVIGLKLAVPDRLATYIKVGKSFSSKAIAKFR
jgi:lipopolysaccharide exporter